MLRTEVSTPVIDVEFDGFAAEQLGRFERLRAADTDLPAVKAKVLAQLEKKLVDRERPPRLTFHLRNEKTWELPDLTLHALEHWLDPTVPPVPLEIAAAPPPAAAELAARMNACTGEDDGDDDRRAVAAALKRGLEARIGVHLSDTELAVYASLAALASAGGSRGLRVCQSCRVIFEAPRARFCASCRRNPPRSSNVSPRRPAFAGDRRLACVRWTAVDGIVTMQRCGLRRGTPRQTLYAACCATCGAVFTSRDGRSAYCPTHATTAARSRRHRVRARERASGNSGNDSQRQE